MPLVSIIVPCFNEEETIQVLLKAISEQDYPQDEIEVIIADGLSTDNTRQKIIDFLELNPGFNLRIVNNPKRNIPNALNIGVNNAKGEFIVRLDGHSIPDKSYIRKCIENLNLGNGNNVGGTWIIEPRSNTWQARSISKAAAHPLAVGDARYRIGGKAQCVDTVPFGSMRKEYLVGIGLYDENLLSNEDYELNTRIRKAGGKIWFDPSIKSIYFASSSYKSLFKQYWRYGFWKVKMLQIHPETIRWRQALPPLLVLGTIILLISGFFSNVFWILLGICLLGYIAIMIGIGLHSSLSNHDATLVVGIPISITIMHFTWGSAFLWGLISIFVMQHESP